MRGRTVIVAAVVTALVGSVIGRAYVVKSFQVPRHPSEEIPVAAGALAAELSAAITFATVSHQNPAERDEMAFAGLREHLVRRFPLVFSKLETETIGDAILIRWPGSVAATAPVVLMGHLDVVPVAPEALTLWTHPPFSGAISSGYVWGRGALDDKGPAIAILAAVERHLAQGFVPGRTIYIAFGFDEEVGGRRGAQAVAEAFRQRDIRPLFVLDEGLAITQGMFPGIDRPVALIGVAEKGYLSVDLIARGRGGHSSTPDRDGAIPRLARALARLDAQPFPAALSGVARDLLRWLTPELPFGPRLVLANMGLVEPWILRRLEAKPATNALIRTTVAQTMLSAGVKENVLPGEARAVVNLRLLPGDSAQAALSRLRDIIADPEVEVVARSGIVAEASPVSPVDGPGFRAIQLALSDVVPEAIVAPSLVVGATDGRHFSGVADAVYRFAPARVTSEDLARIHGVDERIAIDDYANEFRFYYRLIANVGN